MGYGRSVTVAALLGTGVLGSVAPASAAPSFDCRRASSVAEKEICGLPELGNLDGQIAALFTAALAAVPTADVPALRQDQREWLGVRNDCEDMIHGDPPILAEVNFCLNEQMTARVTRLKAIIARKQYFR